MIGERAAVEGGENQWVRETALPRQKTAGNAVRRCRWERERLMEQMGQMSLMGRIGPTRSDRAPCGQRIRQMRLIGQIGEK